MTIWNVRSFALAAMLANTGCSTSDSAADRTATVRDSAGVRIVENTDPVWTTETRWTVDSLPVVTIGVEEGDPQREFFRLTDARRLADGRYVAANAGSNELRYFSAEGNYLCTSGRRGSGPGEFDRLSWLQTLPGDTLVAYSWGGGGRLSVIAPDGRFVRMFGVPRITDTQFPTPLGLLANGALLVRSSRSYGIGVASGTYRDSASLAVFRTDGREVARIGPLPNTESVVAASDNAMSVSLVMFGRYLVTKLEPGGFLVGTGERYEIARYDTVGRLTRLLRLARVPEPVTATAIAYAESAQLASARNDAARARTRALFEHMRVPPTMPSYKDMLADEEGNLWVARYSYLPEQRAWDVFDSSGQLLGEVRMPRALLPRQITDSLMIGVARDESDIERVQVYRIRKGGLAPDEGIGVHMPNADDQDVMPSAYRACGASER